MSKIDTAIKVIKSNRGEFMASIVTNFFRWLPDATYLKLLYRFKMGRRLDLKDPKTFTEKIQWLKLYSRKPEYTTMVDKYAVKEYVANIIGEEYIIPTLDVWEKPEDIDWESLPQQFVLKTTHGGGCGGVVICKDKATFDKDKTIAKLNQSLNSDIYSTLREWVYKDIKPRIIAEPYLEDLKTGELRDYKFFCFDGEVKLLFVASARQTRTEPFFDFFDTEYNPLPILQGHPNSDIKPEKPLCFEEMKILASKLSEDFAILRVDFYEVNGKAYFGELTFYHFGGFIPFVPEQWDYILGQYIKLP